MKNVKKSYRNKLLFFFISLLIFIGLTIGIVFLNISSDIKAAIFILLSVVFLIVLFYFKAYFEQDLNLLRYYRLKDNSDEFTNVKLNPFNEELMNDLLDQGFKEIIESKVKVYYKTLNKNDNKIASKGILLAYFFITDNTINFNDPMITKLINYIEDNSTKENRFNNYSLILFKELTNKGKAIDEDLSMIRFEKINKNHINLIPVLYDQKKSRIHYFNNTKYAPNRYYLFTIEQVNNYLKK